MLKYIFTVRLIHTLKRKKEKRTKALPGKSIRFSTVHPINPHNIKFRRNAIKRLWYQFQILLKNLPLLQTVPLLARLRNLHWGSHQYPGLSKVTFFLLVFILHIKHFLICFHIHSHIPDAQMLNWVCTPSKMLAHLLETAPSTQCPWPYISHRPNFLLISISLFLTKCHLSICLFV